VASEQSPETPSASETSAATFVFADIAGFTALTEAHGDEHAARLVDEFCASVLRCLPPGGEHVKTIGDAVMLRIAEPADAIRMGLTLTGDAAAGHGASAVRVGLHYGSAIKREGDYFGAAVNLAARVSSVAAGGEVLMTGETAARAAELEGVYFEARGRHVLRNIRDPVELFAAIPIGAASAGLPVDPVCQMTVDPDRAPGRVIFDDHVYFFCSLPCTASFASNPERFVEVRA
jgi:class 3 adenylate cyclase/YHS domain-containing protein